MHNLLEGFNLFFHLIKVSNNFNKVNINFNPTYFFILSWKWYYGIFFTGYNITHGPLNLFKNHYLGRFNNHPKNP